MSQLSLALLACAALAAVAAAAPEGGAEFAVPCNDDGKAHIPDLPEGQRRPYSVRKRSRTVHRDPSAVTDDTPQLPPGQRRFDAVLPDEQGHDVATSTTARGARHRGQRRLSEDDANDVAADAARPQPQRRPVRRPVRPRKLAELNEAAPEHDAKTDAVVDSYEAVQRYPTHLPAEDDLDDDGNLASNDIAGAPMPLHDQVALEDVPTATTEQRVDGDPDLPPGYRSKFPKRTFASDAGGSGDVLRVKPRKHANQYQPPPQHDENGDVQGAPPAPPPQRRQPAPRPRPAVRHEEGLEEVAEVPAEAPQQRYRASHRVRQGGEHADQPQRRQPPRRRIVETEPVATDAVAGEDPALANHTPGAVDAGQPLRRQPGPPQPEQGRRPLRRRLRPRPAVTEAPVDNLLENDPVATTPAILVEEPQVADVQPQPGQPQQRPLRRRLRPRPVAVEETEEAVDNSSQRRAPPAAQRRRRPQAAARTVSEESFSAQSNQGTKQVPQTAQEQQRQQRPRGQGRRLAPASAVQALPQVEVEHDGTAQHNKNEPTLVRSTVKKVPSGAHGGDPSPALIQKIVKNTLKRLQPQIAEHEGDVGVDILVKIIEVEDR